MPNEIDQLREALRIAADRFDDLAGLMESGVTYTNAGFLRASAQRCRQVIGDNGDSRSDIRDTMTRALATAREEGSHEDNEDVLTHCPWCGGSLKIAHGI